MPRGVVRVGVGDVDRQRRGDASTSSQGRDHPGRFGLLVQPQHPVAHIELTVVRAVAVVREGSGGKAEHVHQPRVRGREVAVDQ